MEKKRLELVVTGILVLILAGLVIKTMVGKDKTVSSSLQVRRVDEFEIMATSKGAQKNDKVESEDKDVAWGRDPFILVRPDAPVSTSSNLELNGIIWDDAKPYVIINGEVLRAGDFLGNNMVVYIGRTSVIMDNGTEQIELKLWE